ncbi:MAG TPA: tannase/feruloyl esterase family alpha/beta hydrolase [Bryobacteraceae bacterium]|nr:tannase/feruloyl esterase family alpha/beta hydrolase [Bryobacteraceae bacterium]
MSISDCFSWFSIACLAGAAAVCPVGRAATCETLADLKLSGTAITIAQAVPAGSFTPPEGQALNNLPAFCRVAGVIKPSSDSNIQFEVWMPASGWNGKFQGIGNGGFAGAIDYRSLGAAVTRGYAAAETDTGHRASGTDATWALGHPQKVIDFGYRAIHEMTEKGKAIAAAFYGGGPKRSYFSSCSNGGRQALMEAQRYPADYDGIVAGAPANYWTHLLAEAVSNLRALLDDPASYIPPAKLPAIQAAALAACDARDGVKDGLIENPAQCTFDPAVLLCKDTETDACLTAPQAAALKQLYAGLRNGKGQLLFPGYSPGGEAEPGGWAAWITGAAPGKSLMYAFGTQFFMNMMFENAAWDFHTFNVDRDVKAADDKLAGTMNATDADLKKFRDRGGKLILYHGWSDAAIPAQNAIDYFESVVKKMGARESGDFLRLYMVPGMQHCGGGSGPNSFDMAAPLERWVEQNTAPQEVVARGGARTRPLCPYPLVAKYKGAGSTDDAANFVCGK